MSMTRTAWAVTLGGVLLIVPAAWAAEGVEHVGSVIAVDTTRHTITIDEMGPWHPGRMSMQREVFALTPDTRVALACRQDVAGGYPGQWTEQPLPASALRVGDFATVTTRREGGRLQATTVVVVRSDGAGHPSGAAGEPANSRS